ncbi:MAG: DUF1877 family protein [Deltaproteobacteria bacterium]|nr:DUF1877 family protein [Deltaproteobacteria bacterium]
MWQIKMAKMDQLIISGEACEEFLEAQFPGLAEEDEKEGRGERKTKYSVDPEDEGIDFGKSWHILHYLITGNDEGGDSTLDFAIMVGHPVEGLGGEFCWLTPEEVRDIANALDGLSKEDMRKRSGKDAMSKVDIYRCPPGLGEDEFKYAMKDFRALKKYYRDAAEKGNAMLRLIS